MNAGVKEDLSVNLKYTLSPNVTLDAAINPDFAEIEADAPVVQANQRFPIFSRRNGPSFWKGKEIFDSPLQPFYSRTIVDSDFAAKLTGKIGSNSFGLLVATDNAPGNYSDDERTDPIIGPRIRDFVGKNTLSVYCDSSTTSERRTTSGSSQLLEFFQGTVILLAALMERSS